MAVDAGIYQIKMLFSEPVNEKAKPCVNIVVAREEDQENKLYQKLEEYQQEETKKVIAGNIKRRQCSSMKHLAKKKRGIYNEYNNDSNNPRSYYTEKGMDNPFKTSFSSIPWKQV